MTGGYFDHYVHLGLLRCEGGECVCDGPSTLGWTLEHQTPQTEATGQEAMRSAHVAMTTSDGSWGAMKEIKGRHVKKDE